MSSAPTRARRRRWALALAAATALMVLASSLVLYQRLETYLIREMEGSRQEGLGPAEEARLARTHERRMRYHQALILWAFLGSGLAAWGIAWWASGRLFGPLEEAILRESAFAADAAHGMRTPLTALVGEIELALRAPGTPEEQRAVLASALEEVRRLSGLVNHLLFLARAESGQERLAMGELDVPAFLRELEEAFGPLAEEKGLKLVVETAPALVLRGDRVRLRQALANLLDNAIRLTASGEVRLKACVEGGMTVLSVEDTGPGIAPEMQGRLFRRFQRGPGSPGSGLGLAFVRWVAEAHGGSAEGGSLPGGGARFALRLPRA